MSIFAKFVVQRNASEFAVFYIYENPKLIFHSLLLYFFPNDYQHRPGLGYSLGEKNKAARNEKPTLAFCIYEIWQILKQIDLPVSHSCIGQPLAIPNLDKCKQYLFFL